MAWLPLIGTVMSLVTSKGIDVAQQAMIQMDETNQLLLQAREMQHQEALGEHARAQSARRSRHDRA